MADQRDNTASEAAFDAAAQWHARLTSGEATDADIERHMDWLLEDPAHADAYEAVAQLMQDAGAFEQAARAVYADDLEQEAATPAKPPRRLWDVLSDWSWPQTVVAAAVAATLLFVTITAVFDPVPGPDGPQRYAAPADRVERIALADGSQASLFAGARLSVTMTDDRRHLTLLEGRAFFDVQTDADRPFVVTAGAQQVTVLGTRFEVMRGDGFDRVAVNEGRVEVAPIAETGAPEAEALIVEPGTIARFAAGTATPEITSAPAALIGAWSEGVLAFSDEPLPTIIDRLNVMFPDQQTRLGDPALATLEFSGTLVVSTPEQMVRQLAAFLELQVTVSAAEFILTRQ